MKFNNHIVPEDYQEPQDYRDALAIGTVIECARCVGMSYTFKGAFNVYKSKIKTFGVIISNKSFTSRGDDCIYEACKSAVNYMLDSFKVFEDTRIIRDRLLAEKNKFCKQSKLNQIIPV